MHTVLVLFFFIIEIKIKLTLWHWEVFQALSRARPILLLANQLHPTSQDIYDTLPFLPR